MFPQARHDWVHPGGQITFRHGIQSKRRADPCKIGIRTDVRRITQHGLITEFRVRRKRCFHHGKNGGLDYENGFSTTSSTMPAINTVGTSLTSRKNRSERVFWSAANAFRQAPSSI